MHFELLTLGAVSGAIASSAALGTVYLLRFRKQLKKQSYQVRTIEQLYNEVRRTSTALDRNWMGTIHSLIQALEARDSYTRGHSDRVNRFSVAIGKGLGLKERELQILDEASLLHDIGKIGVYDRILLKPAHLNEDEMKLMKSHPDLAAEILKSLPFLEDHIPAILHHHERFDGGGYPNGLKGKQIPLGARIIQVADTWDAMISDRPYRRRLSFDEAFRELQKGAGTQLDPDCVNVFSEWLLKRRGKQTVSAHSDANTDLALSPA